VDTAPIPQNLTRILLIEEHQLIRLGIKNIFGQHTEFKIIAETDSGAEGFRLLRELRPDVTLMDLRTTDVCGVDFLRLARQAALDAKIVFLVSDVRDMEISRGLRAGPVGFVPKDAPAEELLRAVRTVLSGKNYVPGKINAVLAENLGQEDLTPSEQKVLEMIVEHGSNKEIAATLRVSENTVRTHLKNIFEKLGVTDRTSAVIAGLRRGIMRIDY
jgi:two-component system NarL family response regulator